MSIKPLPSMLGSQLPSANIEQAIARRHEPKTFSTTPFATEVFDYSGPAQLASAALQQLDEALPLGQAGRCEAAYRALRAGVDELGVWLRSRGVNV